MNYKKETIERLVKEYRSYSTKQLVKWLFEHDIQARILLYISYVDPNYSPGYYIGDFMERYNQPNKVEYLYDNADLIGHDNNFIEAVLRERYEKQEKKEPFFELFIYNIFKTVTLNKKYTDQILLKFLHESYKQLCMVEGRDKKFAHYRSTRVLKEKYHGDRIYLVVSNAIKDVPLGAKVLGFDSDTSDEYYRENYREIKYVYGLPGDSEIIITREVHKSKLLEIEAD
jgi:hypothetical protein